MMKIKNILGLALITTAIFFTSCEKEFDTVPVKELSSENIITIDSLRNIYNGFDTTIVGDYSIYGVVTADEVLEIFLKNCTFKMKPMQLKLRLKLFLQIFILVIEFVLH